MNIQPWLSIVLSGLFVTLTTADGQVDVDRKLEYATQGVGNNRRTTVPASTKSPNYAKGKQLMEALEIEIARRTRVLEKKLKAGEKNVQLLDSEGISGYRRIEEYLDEDVLTEDTNQAPAHNTNLRRTTDGDGDGHAQQLFNGQTRNAVPFGSIQERQVGNHLRQFHPAGNSANVGHALSRHHQRGWVDQSRDGRNAQRFHQLENPSPFRTSRIQRVEERKVRNENEHGNTNNKQRTINTKPRNSLAEHANFDPQPERMVGGKTFNGKSFSTTETRPKSNNLDIGNPKAFGYHTKYDTNTRKTHSEGYPAESSSFKNDFRFLGQNNAVHGPHPRWQHPSQKALPDRTNQQQDNPYYDDEAEPQYPMQKMPMQQRRSFKSDDDQFSDHHRSPLIVPLHAAPEARSFRPGNVFHASQDRTLYPPQGDALEEGSRKRAKQNALLNSHTKRQRQHSQHSQHPRSEEHAFGDDIAFFDHSLEERYPVELEAEPWGNQLAVDDDSYHFHDPHTGARSGVHRLTQQVHDDQEEEELYQQQYLPEADLAPEEHVPVRNSMLMPYPHHDEGHHRATYEGLDNYEEVDIDKLDPNDYHVNFGPRDGKARSINYGDRRKKENSIVGRYDTDTDTDSDRQRGLHPGYPAVRKDEKRYETDQHYKHPAEDKGRRRGEVSHHGNGDDVTTRRRSRHFKLEPTSREYDEETSGSHERRSKKYSQMRHMRRVHSSESSSESSSAEEGSKEALSTTVRHRADGRNIMRMPAVTVNRAAVNRAVVNLAEESSVQGRFNGTHRLCYQCGWTAEKTMLYEGSHSEGWDRCRYAFHHGEAATFGMKTIECRHNCYIKVDSNDHVHRGCYRGEEGVSPAKLGCHKQGPGAAVFCFCRGAKCNSSNAPAFF